MFDYLIEKINAAELIAEPFPHIHIKNFFSSEDFETLVSSAPIKLPVVDSDKALIKLLYAENFKEIIFPGTTTDVKQYLKWHKNKARDKHTNNETCEGFGITMRLQETSNPIVNELMTFLASNAWVQTIADKFNIRLEDVTSDNGLQKYLDGYEISPHPDMRKKALTYMVNINPAPNSEELEIHTHYLKFLPQMRYVSTFWEGNLEEERCWVPWDWCTTEKIQNDNNSIVVFQPSNDTLHAVRANYDHLQTQRTQLYGNLWFNDIEFYESKPNWRDFVIKASKEKKANHAQKLLGLFHRPQKDNGPGY